MKRLLAILILLLLVGLLWLTFRSQPVSEVPSPEPPPTQSQTTTEPMVGERLLATYADPAQPPQNDLTLMSRLLENYQLVAKHPDAIPLGSNAELAATLRGNGRVKIAVLPASHKAFDITGQLIDRWGSPLFFHAETAQKLDIRSAGPDKTMWTADDIHRDATGHFRTAQELNPTSLHP